jgi:hypothetical protein
MSRIIVLISWRADKPQTATIINSKTKTHKHFELWKPGTGRKICDVLNDEKIIKKIINSYESLILDYKTYIDYFGVSDQIVYDFCGHLDGNSFKDHLKFAIKYKNEFFKQWQIIRGDAAEVYYKLQERGVKCNHSILKPIYGMDVFSGRTKTKKFNIQGIGAEYDLKHINPENSVFVQFDWIAADPRIAGILAEDNELLDCYIKADPYARVLEKISHLTRKECKLEFMMSLNALNEDNDVISVFPKLKRWISNCKSNLAKNGSSKTILGRKFECDGSLKSMRRAFNSIMQGSVAHAMNLVIKRVDDECGDVIMVEQHDSMTVCLNPLTMKTHIEKISQIMYQPFKGILSDEITMPLTIAVGKEWQKYKKYKEIR